MDYPETYRVLVMASWSVIGFLVGFLAGYAVRATKKT
jgi:uncharacterized membrane protein (Fun14 family)